MLLSAIRDRSGSAVLLAAVLVYAGAVGFVAAKSLTFGVVMAALGLAVAVAWNDVTRLAVLAVPGVWLISRLPGVDVSITDALVTAAGTAALIAGVGRALQRPARVLFTSFAFYLLSLTVTVVVNHSFRSDFELFHRIGIVGGGVLAGALLVQRGMQHHALRLLLLVGAFFGGAAVVYAAATGFQPAFPFGYNKNFLGSIAATTLLTVLAARSSFRLPRGLLLGGTALTALGLLASQSRAAMLAVTVGALIWICRVSPEQRRRYWKVILVFGIVFGIVAGFSLRSEVQSQATVQHNSITQRVEVETQTQALWEHNPVTGVGLRFFAITKFIGYQPPNNVLNEILAEAGFPGLVGFLIFVAGSIGGLWRCRGDLAVAGTCVVAARFAHGLVDIYWTGGTTTLPWLVAGMGVAAAVPWAPRAALLRRERTATATVDA